MSNSGKKKLTRLLMWAGIILIIASVAAVPINEYSKSKAAEAAKKIAQTLISVIPEASAGATENISNKVMPALEIEGNGYCAVIEIPKFSTFLPVGEAWEKNMINRCPHRFWGSVYEKNLIIGGSDAEGQFDFMKLISVGDAVYVTDMNGARFSYTVADAEHTDEIALKKLKSESYDLTLFARSSMSFDYTVIYLELN